MTKVLYNQIKMEYKNSEEIVDNKNTETILVHENYNDVAHTERCVHGRKQLKSEFMVSD